MSPVLCILVQVLLAMVTVLHKRPPTLPVRTNVNCLAQLEYSRPVFCLIGAALFVATVLPIIALATPDWLLIGYKTQSFMGVVIDVTVRMGLMQQLTTSGSLTQKDATMWCGDGSTTDPSPWCNQVRQRGAEF